MYSGVARSSYRKHCWSGRGHLSHEVRGEDEGSVIEKRFYKSLHCKALQFSAIKGVPKKCHSLKI